VFCDIVNSTDLAGRLDPEELADVDGGVKAAVRTWVGQWEGHLAEYLGDGAVVYFGWPTAHEDDADRAVHAALELILAVGRLSAAGASLSARVGIATTVTFNRRHFEAAARPFGLGIVAPADGVRRLALVSKVSAQEGIAALRRAGTLNPFVPAAELLAKSPSTSLTDP
jgi:hypothetical protein